MRKVALVSVISFFVTLLVITGFSRPAVAQETYYGCISLRFGSFRIVSDPSLCRTRGEVAISWYSAQATSDLAAQVSAQQDTLSETQNAMCDWAYSHNLLPLPSFCRPKLVFVSSALYTGDFGGLGGADAKCQALASAAGLSGTFKAWLSNMSASPSNRFTHWPLGYALVDGTLIADSWADLTDESLIHPINVTESGGPPPATEVWTATDPFGNSWFENCYDWTDTTYLAMIGWNDNITSGWTDHGLASCSGFKAIYCFQQ